VHFESPDVPPLLHGIVGGRRAHDTIWAQEIYSRFPDDFGIENDNRLPPAEARFFSVGPEFVDSWGCARQCARDGLQANVMSHPLADWSRFSNYTPPEVPGDTYADLDRRIAAAGHPKCAISNIGGLFSRMADLRGMENIFMDLYDEESTVAQDLADLVFGVLMRHVGLLCRTDTDCIGIGDDWGTEASMMIDPDQWRSFFKPYYREMFDFIHDHGKDVWFHCCGNILPIVEDMIEIGVNLLHPQMELLMEDESFLPVVRGRLCVVTDIDRDFLCTATPEDVYERTIQSFRKIYQPEGGMVMRGEIGISVPRENAEAFYNACTSFREEVKDKAHV